MRKRRFLLLLLAAWPAASPADLTFPASFDVTEQTPGRFRVSLTVPLVNGRYMKANPVTPEGFPLDDEPEARAGAGSLIRTWHVDADPASLPGSVFGLDGLLGTTRDVRFVLSTLDGRRHEAVLRSMRAVYVVPHAPSLSRLAVDAVLEGLRRAIRHSAFWLLMLCILVPGGGGRAAAAAVAVCAGSAWLGHGTAGPVSSLSILPSVAGLPAAAMLAASGSWARPLPGWAGMALAVAVGFLSGLAGAVVLPAAGLSTAELRLSTGLLLAGWAAGGAGVYAVLALTRSLLPAGVRRAIGRFLPALAAGWFLYQAAGFVQDHGPTWGVVLRRAAKAVGHRWFLPFATDWTLGRIRLPLLTLGLIATAVAVWPRRRRFRPAGRPPTAHWALLAAALLALPVAHWRIRNPLHTVRPPTAREAAPVINTLLTDTYRAFNLDDEDAAFDRLAETLSEELVADVYLDSRRRLTEGTREGAEVSVKEVAVMSVEARPGSTPDQFTYLCRWGVTARVEHWQHIHDRHNIYAGELTIEVRDNRWKISRLELDSEQREVVQGA